MAAQKSSIEFLPKESWEKGATGKFLKWTLTVGRHIVIFTEMLVILAFFSRFKLDRDLTDINEEIKQKQAIIVSSSEFEKNFRLLQKRIETIENLRKSQLEATDILESLSSYTPLDVIISDLTISDNQVSLTATSLSEGGLGQFLKKLKNSDKFEKITLSQIFTGTEKELGIKFQLKSNLRKK